MTELEIKKQIGNDLIELFTLRLNKATKDTFIPFQSDSELNYSYGEENAWNEAIKEIKNYVGKI